MLKAERVLQLVRAPLEELDRITRFGLEDGRYGERYRALANLTLLAQEAIEHLSSSREIDRFLEAIEKVKEGGVDVSPEELLASLDRPEGDAPREGN
jgi:hypothetical protein